MKNTGTITEHRIHCNVCGKIYCYTDAEAASNKSDKTVGVIMSLISGVTGALGASTGGGNLVETVAVGAMGKHTLDKVKDYTRCPFCRSSDIYETTAEVACNSPTKPKNEGFTTGAMEIPKRNHQK